MQDLNLDNYFDNGENSFYDSMVIITILEDILGKSIVEIKEDVNAKQIIVTKEQIEEYLEKKFIEEDPELKKRIDNPKPKRSSNIAKWTGKDIEDASQKFVDSISVTRYIFEPYSLKYFNKYTTIVRNKINMLLNIIEQIGVKNIQSIQNILIDLDIALDESGNISKNDIIRLIIPTVYNINELNAKLEKANDLSTYLSFKESKHSLMRDGISESEIYPSQSLQIKDLWYDHIQGYVRLSENQRKELEEQQRRSSKKFAKMLLNLED